MHILARINLFSGKGLTMKMISALSKVSTVLMMMSAMLSLSANPALALDSFFSGPRALGMAGANIASTNDTNAQYYNPAAFGFMGRQADSGEKIATDNNNLGIKDWGTNLNATAGIRLHQDFGNYIDTLANINYQNLSNNGIASPSDLADLVDLVNGLQGLEEPGNAITAQANLGLGVRIGHFALGGRGAFEVAGQVLNVDTANLGITNSTDLNTQITTAYSAPVGYTPTLIPLTSSLYTDLIAAGLTPDAIKSIDATAVEQGVTAEEITGVTDILATLSEQTLTLTGGALADNTTTVALNGFALAEVPLSYGYAINDHWSVGGNAKVIKGRVYGTEVLVFDDGSGDVISSVTDNYQDSTTFGIDLGVMGRYKMFNFGLIGRNLNSPEFDGFAVDTLLSNGETRTVQVASVKVKPQVAAGVAFIPLETLTLEVDYDLTKNDTLLSNYATQNLSVGLEWNAFHFLAMRAGAYKNMVQSDIGVVYTAGLGLNFWAVRLDIGGAYSGETARYDGKDYPKESQISAQLSVDF